jgi:hypothetical protein
LPFTAWNCGPGCCSHYLISPSSGRSFVRYKRMLVQIFTLKLFWDQIVSLDFMPPLTVSLCFCSSAQSVILVLACICSGPECYFLLGVTSCCDILDFPDKPLHCSFTRADNYITSSVCSNQEILQIAIIHLFLLSLIVPIPVLWVCGQWLCLWCLIMLFN